MQHTVIAFFDTETAAEAARAALLGAGLPNERIALQARCEPTYATDATAGAGTPPPGSEGLLASIERFFESLFTSAPPSQEAAQYAEAFRRGAVMVSVDAADDAQCELARVTLQQMHPIDIEERAATWRAPADDVLHERSPLEELGLRSGVQRHQSSGVRSYPRQADVAPGAGETMSTRGTEAAAVAARREADDAAILAAKRGTRTDVSERPPSTPPTKVPDEYLENEEDFSGKKDGDR